MSSLRRRTQPELTFWPMLVGSFVPWMPSCPGPPLNRQRIAGLAVWEFGFVLDGFYSQMARKIAPPLELRASFDDRIRKGEATTVTGKVLRGDAGVAGARVTGRPALQAFT